MDPSTNFMEFCRLCLDKDSASVPIFEGEGLDRNICMKIGSCLPVKVSNDDPLPKKICDDCTNKLDNFYSFWSTTANSEKQLLDWLSSKKNESEPFMEVVKTEMVTLKDESGDLDMSEVPAEVDESDPTEESQDTVDQRPAPDDSDEQSQGEEDTGGGSANDPPSEDATQASPSTSTTEAGPSGVQVPAASKPETATQSSLPQLPAQLNIVPTDSPRSALELLRNAVNTNFVLGLPMGRPSGPIGSPLSRTKPPPLALRRELSPPRMVQQILPPRAQLYRPGAMPSCPPSFCPVPQGANILFRVPQLPIPFGVALPRPGPGPGPRRPGVVLPHAPAPAPGPPGPPGAPVVSAIPARPQHSESRGTSSSSSAETPSERGWWDALNPSDPFSQDMPKTRTSGKENVCTPDPDNPSGETGATRRGKWSSCFLCEVCGETVNGQKSARHRHKQRHSPPKHMCPVCEKLFFLKWELKAHMHSHREEKKFKCDVCPFSTNWPTTIAYHKRRHAADFSVSCDKCGMGFVALSHLQNHVKYVHERIQCKCEYCQEVFPKPWMLNSHVGEKHGDEGKYPCGLCDSKLPSPHHVQKHQAEAHAVPKPPRRRKKKKVQSFLCPMCGKSISTNSSLMVHMRTHTGEKPFKCSFCDTFFASKNILKTHERVQHLKERRHKCEECGKTFTQRTTYKIHSRLHTGERPYPCDECDAAFVSRSALNSHRKKHTT